MASSGPKADLSMQPADAPGKGGAGPNGENSLFNKHYNKELKLCEGKFAKIYDNFSSDEIPMVLCELNESALAYLNRDQFENALLLL